MRHLKKYFADFPENTNIERIKCKFWEMFVVDFFIGNTDRHNNIGDLFLIKVK